MTLNPKAAAAAGFAAPSPRRRYTMVTNGLVHGGAETQQVRLAIALQRRGHSVRFLSILPTRAFADELAAEGIGIDELAAVSDPSLLQAPAVLRRAVRALNSWQPDIAISFVYQSNILARLACRSAGTSVVISSVRNETFGGPMRDRTFKYTDGLSGATTSNSAVTADRLLRDRLVPPAKLHVVPNAIDLVELAPDPQARTAVRRELGVADHELLWLAIGRLRPQKDFALLVSAMARTDPAQSHRLVIAGVGPLQHDLESQIASLGLADRVQLLGLRQDVPRLLQGADVLALSSAWEGLPNVVMEAMAARLPVVATDVGGVRELVVPRETGVIVTPGDPDALGAALSWVGERPSAERAAMGELARQRIGERFGVGPIVDLWESIGEGLLAARDASGRRAPVGVGAAS